MDDLAICVSAGDATALERKDTATIGILLEVCAEYGITPNLKQGKTEVLLAFRGRGSRHLRRKDFSEQFGRRLQVLHEHGTA